MLQPLEPDALEFSIAVTKQLPDCPFCGRSAFMHSSVNHHGLGGSTVFQARIACNNHECNASVVCNMRTREEAQQGAIQQWSRRAA